MPSLQIPEKLEPLLKPKKFKIIYGGRGSGKSMTVAGLLLVRIATEGIKVAAMREMMNSIDDSVHSLFVEEIERLQIPGFTVFHNRIEHESGGEITYKGLARNPESVKSMHGYSVFWVEEAATLSKKSIDLLIPTLRKEGSELWFTFNLAASNDPTPIEFIKPFESQMVEGCYEDDLYLIIKANYTDNPFFPENLERLRQQHFETKSRAEYNHIWLGYPNDEVEDSIIKAEWFDSAIDAHKKLPAIKSTGAIVCAYDPADGGNDDHGFACRHGSIIRKVDNLSSEEIDVGTDWATGEAIKLGADLFTWDLDGMGTGLKRQVDVAFNGKKCEVRGFRGSLSGVGQDDGEKVYQEKTYAETFKNNRARYYNDLATRFFNTYRAVTKGEYIDPDEMISLDSDGILDIDRLRSELCRIPTKPNANGLIQIMNKQDMKKEGIASPNMADAIMMTMICPAPKDDWGELEYDDRGFI
jgi:phage terminase large subunit